MFEQAGADRDVARHFHFAIVDRAHGMRNLEAGVPKLADEALDRALGGAVGERPRQQHEDVDVRVGEQCRAAVAPHSHKRGAGRSSNLGPDAADNAISELRLALEQPLRVGVRGKSDPQRLAAGGEFPLPALRLCGSRRDECGSERRGHVCATLLARWAGAARRRKR